MYLDVIFTVQAGILENHSAFMEGWFYDVVSFSDT